MTLPIRGTKIFHPRYNRQECDNLSCRLAGHIDPDKYLWCEGQQRLGGWLLHTGDFVQHIITASCFTNQTTCHGIHISNLYGSLPHDYYIKTQCHVRYLLTTSSCWPQIDIFCLRLIYFARTVLPYTVYNDNMGFLCSLLDNVFPNHC